MSDSIAKYYDNVDNFRLDILEIITNVTNSKIVNENNILPALWESLYNGKSTIFHLENKCMFLINYEEIINPKFIIKAGVQTKPNCYWCYTTKPII